MSYIKRRQLILAAAALPLARLGTASAQQYPDKPIRLVVPTSVGTSADSMARFFGDALTREFGLSVVVENRSGAGGVLAYQSVARSAPDGYTLLMAGLPLQLLPLMSEVPDVFDPIKDFTHVCRVARAPLGIVVAADSPYQTLGDLVNAMRTASPEMTYASGGHGTSGHMCIVMLTQRSNTRATHVPFKDISSAVLDVAANRIDFTCQGSASVIPLIQSGRLRPLAVTGLTRWEALPEIPTAAEAGAEGVEVWPGLDIISSAGVPTDIVNYLSEKFLKIAESDEYRAFCQKQGLARATMPHEQLKKVVPQEAVSWRSLVEASRQS